MTKNAIFCATSTKTIFRLNYFDIKSGEYSKLNYEGIENICYETGIMNYIIWYQLWNHVPGVKCVIKLGQYVLKWLTNNTLPKDKLQKWKL